MTLRREERPRAALLDLLPDRPEALLAKLLRLETRLREAILGGRAGSGESAVVREGAAGSTYSGDTIYHIDERGEAALLEFCEDWGKRLGRPFVLIAEGLPGDGRMVFPRSGDLADAVFECIVDPIDGTRGLMYHKRSAWALAAIAPGAARLGRPADLRDVVIAAQTELTTARARLTDTLWAVAGRGVAGTTLDLATGEQRPLTPTPSTATGLAHGFAMISKFFPGSKERAVWIEERLFAEVVGDHAAGAPLVFDDQYISSGGQLYELMVGHDRFVADLRPVLMDAKGIPGRDEARAMGGSSDQGTGSGGGVRRLCCRPYDVCTALIAEDAGVLVTDAWGRPLSAPLDTSADVSWVGYANEAIRALVAPVLQRLLRELGAPEPYPSDRGRR